jgi:hypothetical protein
VVLHGLVIQHGPLCCEHTAPEASQQSLVACGLVSDHKDGIDVAELGGAPPSLAAEQHQLDDVVVVECGIEA